MWKIGNVFRPLRILVEAFFWVKKARLWQRASMHENTFFIICLKIVPWGYCCFQQADLCSDRGCDKEHTFLCENVKFFTFQWVECWFRFIFFVKKVLHGESPCAVGRLVTTIHHPWWPRRDRGFSGAGLNSPGGTRHHAMAHSATLQPLSGGAFLWTKKARAGRRGRQGINNKTWSNISAGE